MLTLFALYILPFILVQSKGISDFWSGCDECAQKYTGECCTEYSNLGEPTNLFLDQSDGCHLCVTGYTTKEKDFTDDACDDSYEATEFLLSQQDGQCIEDRTSCYWNTWKCIKEITQQTAGFLKGCTVGGSECSFDIGGPESECFKFDETFTEAIDVSEGEWTADGDATVTASGYLGMGLELHTDNSNLEAHLHSESDITLEIDVTLKRSIATTSRSDEDFIALVDLKKLFRKYMVVGNLPVLAEVFAQPYLKLAWEGRLDAGVEVNFKGKLSFKMAPNARFNFKNGGIIADNHGVTCPKGYVNTGETSMLCMKKIEKGDLEVSISPDILAKAVFTVALVPEVTFELNRIPLAVRTEIPLEISANFVAKSGGTTGRVTISGGPSLTIGIPLVWKLEGGDVSLKVSLGDPNFDAECSLKKWEITIDNFRDLKCLFNEALSKVVCNLTSWWGDFMGSLNFNWPSADFSVTLSTWEEVTLWGFRENGSEIKAQCYHNNDSEFICEKANRRKL